MLKPCQPVHSAKLTFLVSAGEWPLAECPFKPLAEWPFEPRTFVTCPLDEPLEAWPFDAYLFVECPFERFGLPSRTRIVG